MSPFVVVSLARPVVLETTAGLAGAGVLLKWQIAHVVTRPRVVLITTMILVRATA